MKPAVFVVLGLLCFSLLVIGGLVIGARGMASTPCQIKDFGAGVYKFACTGDKFDAALAKWRGLDENVFAVIEHVVLDQRGGWLVIVRY